MAIDYPTRQLTDEERRNYGERIVKMRDCYLLPFTVIAARLGISPGRAGVYYKQAKGRKGE